MRRWILSWVRMGSGGSLPRDKNFGSRQQLECLASK